MSRSSARRAPARTRARSSGRRTSGIVVDLFCGGGGASEGIRGALGRDPDVAVNHDEAAITMHEANHPGTRHLRGDVWSYRPREAVGDAHVSLLWASPTCTFFSKAKGGPLDRRDATRTRSLAWVVVRWAREVMPTMIVVENVEAFAKWGPLDNEGKAIKSKAGLTFRKWVRDLENLGYEVEWRELRACDYGAPTSRRRLFVIARCDGEAIEWPQETHGPGIGLEPWRTAAECIDWTIPAPSIFDRKRPLAEPTMRRIARGVHKFVLGEIEPFIVPTRHGGDARVHSIREPMRTVTASNRGELAVVSPALVHVSNGERKGQAPRIYDIREPLGTVVAGGVKQGLVTAFLAKHFGGHESPGASLHMPMSTVTCRDHHALVRAFLTQYNGESIGQRIGAPMNTITTRERFGLVTVQGTRYRIVDIGMRLLVPAELFAAQGFPRGYVIDPVMASGKAFTKTAQVKMAGNSVPPQFARAIVAANMPSARRLAA